ncbi:glucan 1,3-beta-glucosidase, partial [Tremellales sp. Uapishka_1]
MFQNKPDWVVDEWTYGQYMAGQNDTMAEIVAHWESWFQYAELENIASVGLNTVRIPIGWAYSHLQQAVQWAQSLNLKSGLRGTRQWFANQTNIDRTLAALQNLTSEFTQSKYASTVLTIELVNEPFPYSAAELDILKSFYYDGYSTVRSHQNEQSILVVALDEAFVGLTTWTDFMTEPNYHNVALDTHIYSMFDLDLLAMGYTDNLKWYCSQESSLVAVDQGMWTIVGEFTPANTDCALWLNGRGTGARYDNTLNSSAKLQFPGDCSGKSGADPSVFTAEYIDHLARSFEYQTYVYEKASGWLMWTWKAEQAADWSMQEMITYGWIPTPITAKPHG